jgi:enamine deaminase RidA (YjgF/YER057c/UK114 family)
MRPGPLTPTQRPRRKITPRSYSCTILIADANFSEQPKVVNGTSDFLVEVFGEKGSHARSAVGVASLPLNVPVEVEMIVEIEE